MSMNRPPAVNALFAGHSLPRTAKALDQIRGHITRLEEVAKLAHALCERMKTAHNVKRVAGMKRGPVILDDDGEA